MPILAEPPLPAVPTSLGGPLPQPVPAPSASRLRMGLAVAALGLVVVVNVPAFLRTALDCDPILFDLYVRDAGRGAVLYRDMVENNTPGMIGLHWVIRSAFGWSTEALRIADLLIVGAAIALLAGWFHPGRWDRRLLTATLLAILYLSTTEWCHAQRDVWMLLPVMAALSLRRTQLGRLPAARGSFALAVLEGVVWASALWIKPHVAVVAAGVWLVGAVWARANGASLRALLVDATGVILGELLAGAAGIAAMMALGIWQPYVQHLTGWAGEYSQSDLYGAYGPWFFRLAFVLRNAPWSFVYIAMIPVATLLAVSAFRCRHSSQGTDSPDRALLAGATVAWAFQATFLQHIFDYPHIGGTMLALTLLVGTLAAMPTERTRLLGLVVLSLLAVAGHGGLFVQRAGLWSECVEGGSSDLRDRLARYQRIAWADLDRVTGFLQSNGVRDGELIVMSDTALPLWEKTGLRPPVRYYIVHNNLLAFPHRREEILGALRSLPGQRFLVCDLTALGSEPPPGHDWRHPEDWPLPDTWYGPRRWADKVVFRAGRYLVLAMPASDTPAWLADVSDI